MKRTTHRLAGHALRRALKRIISASTALDEKSAEQLADEATRLMPRARLHNDWRMRLAKARGSNASGSSSAPEKGEQHSTGTPAPTSDNTGKTAPATVEVALSTDTDELREFDPYEIQLVPTFQRAGAEALRAQLEQVHSVANLRQMARSQQIALPAEIRRGEVEPEKVRDAILRAVEKRIADRRAAAS